MQNPIDNRQPTIKSILVGIAVMIAGAIPLYFLRFFGLTLKAILQKSIAQASNSELYANILLILAICLLGLFAFIVTLLICRKKEIKTGVDKQPEVMNNRKEKIRFWREELNSTKSIASFIHTVTYIELRDRIPQEEMKKLLEGPHLELTPSIDAITTSDSRMVMRFHKVVSEIEKEWGII